MFISYISIGYFCGVAGSLMKNGYRTFKGPFDWCFSDLASVIELMHNDFTDFMNRKNLEVVAAKPLEFFDRKYKILFNHDVESSFEAEFGAIKAKYDKRVRKFLEASKTPTCFVRAIKNQEEISYISKNEEYILSAVKKHNKDNEVIFIAPTFIDYSALNNTCFKYFELDVKKYARENFQELLDMLDTVPSALEFLQSNYPPFLRSQNLAFNDAREKMIEYYKTKNKGFEERYNLAIRMLNTDLEKYEFPSGVVIYGIGKIGQALYRKIKSVSNVECFIETNPKEDFYDDKRVYSVNDLEKVECKNYIVTPIQDFELIKHKILTQVPDAEVISLDDILCK